MPTTKINRDGEESINLDPNVIINNVGPGFVQACSSLEKAASAISSIAIPDDFEYAPELSKMPSRINSSDSTLKDICSWIINDVVKPLLEADKKNLGLVQELLNATNGFEWLKNILLNREFTFDKNINYSIEYFRENGVMPYSLMTPSSVSDGKPKPVIVWLHGAGTRNNQKSLLESSYNLSTVISESELSNFDAYVLSPHLVGETYWAQSKVKRELVKLLDKFISEHNVDKDNIVLIGGSLGGQGAIYMAANMPEYFSKVVVISGYNPTPGKKCPNIEIPTIGYIGTKEAGEDTKSINDMKNSFAAQVGEENIKVVEASHSNMPKEVYNIDEDGNGKSDVIEWLFSDYNRNKSGLELKQTDSKLKVSATLIPSKLTTTQSNTTPSDTIQTHKTSPTTLKPKPNKPGSKTKKTELSNTNSNGKT